MFWSLMIISPIGSNYLWRQSLVGSDRTGLWHLFGLDFDIEVAQLEPGDTLLAFTDGVTTDDITLLAVRRGQNSAFS